MKEICCVSLTENAAQTNDEGQPRKITLNTAERVGKHRQLEREKERERKQHKNGLCTDQWGYNHVEVPQVHILGTAKLRCKHRHQHLEVLRPLGRVAGQISQH